MGTSTVPPSPYFREIGYRGFVSDLAPRRCQVWKHLGVHVHLRSHPAWCLPEMTHSGDANEQMKRTVDVWRSSRQELIDSSSRL